VNYRFTLGGKINCETLDDAVDILKLILEDQGITVDQISIFGINESLSVCKKRPSLSRPSSITVDAKVKK